MEEDNKNIKVLVVDDEPEQLFAIARILKSAGYEVIKATNGHEALDMVKKELPDLVLLDVVLPDISGIEVSKKIKRNSKLRNILVLLISGIKTSSDIQSEGLEKGADGYLTRPIPKRELIARIESLLRIKKAETELLESEEKYRLIVENAHEGIWSIDANAQTMYVNPHMAEMFGYTIDEMLGKHLFEFMDEKGVEIAEKLLERRKRGIEEKHDFEFIRKDGERIFTNVETSPITDDDGNYLGAIALISDITHRREMEEELRKSLKEKEMLLKEIHHRVKNNLMVISSLLDLQSNYIKDKEALGIFKESQSRARSMALIHERLYQSSDLKNINFGEYIRSLATELYHTYVIDTDQVKLNLDLEDLMLDINTTVPLGLIVNELVSNSMKHAFPPGKSGHITINFHKIDDTFMIKVKDDGVGFPADIDYKNTESLGLQLVNNLTQQIDGEIKLIRNNGTEFEIKFKERKYN